MEVQQTVLELFKKIAEEQKYDNIKDFKPAAIEQGNVMSTLFRATLTTKGKPDLKLFAKLANTSHNLRKETPFQPYIIEIYFNTKLQKIYEELEGKHSIPEEHKFYTPKLYGVRDEYLSETLVFEDIEAQGFQNFNKDRSADMEYMSTGIDLMAKFHALSMVFYQADPEGFRRATENLVMNESMFEQFFVATKANMLSNVLQVTEDHHKARLEKYFNKDHPEWYQLLMNIYRRQNRHILIHGDFKPANLMHRRRNGKLEMRILDFQMVHDGDPVAELMYFIFTATDEQFRSIHYHALLDVYYDRLCVALNNLHLDPEKVYPEKDYRAQVEQSAMMGLLIAVALLPIILVDESKAPDFNTEDADWSELVAKPSALFRERLNGVINNYVEWGLL